MIYLFVFALFAHGAELDTNAAAIHDAPAWLKRNRAERVIDRMQTKLEWTIHKINVQFYTDAGAFYKAHSLGPGVLAVTNKKTNTVHIGPLVGDKDFDGVFGHELVHVIIGQKYKEAIPGWLEEGLANHLAKHGSVDYAYLAKQPFPPDVKALSHPFSGVVRNVRYHYEASQALAELLAKKCDLENLLRLSVGQGIEKYLETYCEIKDLNAEFRKWVQKHS